MLVPSPAAALHELVASGDTSGYVTGCTSALWHKEEKIPGLKPSWHLTQSPRRSAGVPGSDLCNKQPLFPDKEKKICFSLALRICCVFLKQKENLKGHFFAFLWRLYSWLQTISLILKPLSAFFPFGPACPFCWQRRLAACRLCYPREAFFQVVADIPVRDRDSAQCPAQPHCSLLGPCSLWNPSIFSTSTELRGEPCCALGGQQALGVFLLPQHLLSLSHS